MAFWVMVRSRLGLRHHKYWWCGRLRISLEAISNLESRISLLLSPLGSLRSHFGVFYPAFLHLPRSSVSSLLYLLVVF